MRQPDDGAANRPATPTDQGVVVPEPAAATTPDASRRPRLSRSRWGTVWIGLILGALILILLLVFVLQNGQPAQISFLAADGQLPLGVALLLAALAGALIVAIPGSARILQLRRTAKTAQRADPRRETGEADISPPERAI